FEKNIKGTPAAGGMSSSVSPEDGRSRNQQPWTSAHSPAHRYTAFHAQGVEDGGRHESPTRQYSRTDILGRLLSRPRRFTRSSAPRTGRRGIGSPRTRGGRPR